MKILSNFKLNNAIESTSKLLLTLLLAISTLSLACSSSDDSSNNNSSDAPNETPNETPTGISFSLHADFATTVNVGTITAMDPDSGDTFTYTLVAGAGDTDNDLFTLDMNSGALTFNTTASTGAGLGVRKAVGENYDIRLQVTDSGGATFTQALTITEQGTAQVGGQFSGYVDSAGDGLLPENAYIHNLGTVSFASNPDVISLVDGSGDNSDFFILDKNPGTAATYATGILTAIAVDSTNDGSKFLVLDADYAGFTLKATLTAGDFVVGRLSSDATAFTIIDGMGTLTLTLNAAGDSIAVGGITASTTTVPKFDNALIYVGADSGDFEATTPPTLNVEFEAESGVVRVAKDNLQVLTGANAGKDIYWVIANDGDTSTLLSRNADSGPDPSWHESYLIGKVNSAGTQIFGAGLVPDSAWPVSPASIIAQGTIISGTISTENYVVRLADVDEN